MYSTKPDENRDYLVIPLYDLVVFPQSRTKFKIDKATGDLLAAAMRQNEAAYAIALTVKSSAEPSEVTAEGMYRTGSLLKISVLNPSEDGYVVAAGALYKVVVDALCQKGEQFYATCRLLTDTDEPDDEIRKAMLTEIKKAIHEISSHFQGSEHFTLPIDRMDSIDQIIGYVMPFTPVSVHEKQEILEIVSAKQRYLGFLELLLNLGENISIRVEMARKVSEKVTKSNREAMLREQLKVIQEELNESEGTGTGDAGYRERIGKSKMPDYAREKALSELRKLESGGGQNHESHIIRNYLDLLLDLPWVTEEKTGVDIAHARKVLGENHNGLEKVKERIIQHLAVMKLKHEKQGSILLFAGPPGTGKTSLGKSIADALGRKYIRISLGGVRDEAEIRGHRRTYVGALPGRIINGIKRAGTKNPVFILDEIDKLGIFQHGRPGECPPRSARPGTEQHLLRPLPGNPL